MLPRRARNIIRGIALLFVGLLLLMPLFFLFAMLSCRQWGVVIGLGIVCAAI
jgi:hypothetical protein